ncbi:aldose 1-epimerase-like protein [Trypanosoma conorhini]|uniref:glucose-6-phosphate 1-epimerase n=1 Tax=Trypanosoma conorhini TaxID=83891 RepID=A0A3R7L6H7_9TRYP|nr:aldose 1-epimerase-like protein [Trypanosoma conorhini]RNF20762.1 aldose 1-epimerase-like protein [Trypanosoma conorhini]
MDQSVVVAKHDDGSSITVHTQGAHLTSWRNAAGEELLYTSPDAVYKEGVPIRGGVPVIFPQFGGLGPLRSHGFARIREWKLKDVRSGMASFTLEVPASDMQTQNTEVQQGKAISPSGNVSLLYTITFSNEQLQLQMEVTSHVLQANVNFTFAFHTYFAVEDVTHTLVNGVNLTPFIDNLLKERRLQAPQQLWGLKKEVDRIYKNQTCAVLLVDMKKRRTTHISSEHLPDVVVWNPWVLKTAKMKDLPADGYKKFVCVEHGSITTKVSLPPEGVWKASQRIRLLSVSKL